EAVGQNLAFGQRGCAMTGDAARHCCRRTRSGRCDCSFQVGQDGREVVIAVRSLFIHQTHYKLNESCRHVSAKAGRSWTDAWNRRTASGHFAKQVSKSINVAVRIMFAGEVGDLECSVLAEHDIFSFEVAMRDALAMGVRQGVRYLFGIRLNLIGWEQLA